MGGTDTHIKTLNSKIKKKIKTVNLLNLIRKVKEETKQSESYF